MVSDISLYSENIFDDLPDALFISECQADGLPGSYLYVNEAAMKLLGYTRKEFEALNPATINRVVKENAHAYKKISAEIHTQGKALYRTDLLSKGGQWVHVEMSCKKELVSGHSVYLCLARDISVREKYEETIKALVRSTVGLTGKECLDEIVKNLCNWLSVDGACIGNFIGDNFHIHACYHKNKHVNSFCVPASSAPLKAVQGGVYIFYENDAAQYFRGQQYGCLEDSNCFIARPMAGHDGSIIGAVCLFSSQSVSQSPHIEEFLAIIASRAAAECERQHYITELSHSEEMLRILFNSTAEAIVGIDLSGKIVFCNPSTLKILGFNDEEEILGEQFYSISHGFHSFPEPICPYVSAIKNGDKISDEDEFLNTEGRCIPVEYWGHPMRQGNKLVGAVLTFINISKRKSLEQQLQHSQKMEAIGTLTGGIAHDFNNILTVISGYVGLLESQIADQPKVLRKIQKIGAAAERGAKLTNGLLAYGRKKSEPNTPVDLNHLILKVHEIFIRAIGDNVDHKLSLGSEKMIVLADSGQLEQVLINLATNARDAMPEGGTLFIGTCLADIDRTFCEKFGYGEPGRYALITVEDNGVGIPVEIQQQIFDPFFTTKDTGKGTGLGLAMAWGIIKQHKGYIKVESSLDVGSRFDIYLPLSNQKLVYQPGSHHQELPGGAETILLVEDDPLVRESTENILSAVGYQVHVSDCAEAALKFLRIYKGTIHLILSDVVMPGMKGPEFFLELRKIVSCPVIFLSGYTFDNLRVKGLIDRGIPLLSKPVQASVLLQCIREELCRVKV